MKKTKVAVIFGGTNTEHEVSIVSARSVINNLNPEKYDVVPLYISKHNQWAYLPPDQAATLPETVDKAISPDTALNTDELVIFPVLHGPYGEDGTIQGMLEMLHVPYVGCNVIASAMCMDKVVQKQLCLQQGIPVVPFVWTDHYQWSKDPKPTLQYIQNKLHYPLFVKPANQGSSIGIVKVHNESELNQAIESAFAFDSKIIIEEGVDHPREIECAVLGNHNPQASVLGEIIPSNEFYDYNAKYIDGKSETKIPAALPDAISEKIRQCAVKAFQTMNASGLARVDFLIEKTSLRFYLNELNTMPGFTTISMYPKLWQASGLTYAELLDRLVELAKERYQETSKRQLSIKPKTNWQQS
jgi:D-alanine-D-alanine ligase